MTNVLLSGFSPFEGRTVNASWIAARELNQRLASDTIDALELPVLWGHVRELLEERCQRDCPEVIMAMGEGRPGWFDVETRARKSPARRADNNDQLPGEHPWPDGPKSIEASIDAPSLQRRLYYQAIPARVSSDAGGFICEQTLYTLETLRERFDNLQTVVFVHLPPYGTRLQFQHKEALCVESTLLDFSLCLFEAVMAIHQPESDGISTNTRTRSG